MAHCSYWFLWWPVGGGWVFALVCALSDSKVQKDSMEDDEGEQVGWFYFYLSGKKALFGKYSTRCCMFRINAKYVATTIEAPIPSKNPFRRCEYM